MSEYYTRLAATLFAAAVLGVVIARPEAGRIALAEGAAKRAEERLAAAERACAPGEAPLTASFAEIEDVLAITPLAPPPAQNERSAPPDIRISTIRDGRNRPRKTRALTPAKSDVVAIERRIDPNTDGKPYWTVRLKPCDKIAVVYDRLDSIDPALLRRAGGLKAFDTVHPGHSAIATRIRLREGDVVGTADGFDVALEDLSAPPANYVRTGRYVHVDAAIRNPAQARCALAYLDADDRSAWEEKLGDARGARRAAGENACRFKEAANATAAQGEWYTDSSHNGLTNRVSAIVLAPDAIEEGRLVFSFNGRLATLTSDLLPLQDGAARREALRGFFTAPRGGGRLNAPFDQVVDNETYCYQGLRADFAGPALGAIILLRVEKLGGSPALMRIEAQPARSCGELSEWSFSGRETTFFR